MTSFSLYDRANLRSVQVLLDDADADLAKVNWSLRPDGYVSRSINKATTQLIQRVVMSRKLGRALVKGEFVDFENRDRFDVRRANLRIATRSQQAARRAMPKSNTTGFKGVSRAQSSSSWTAYIGHQTKLMYLGSYSSPEAAACAYDLAAVELHGEYAYRNFPSRSEDELRQTADAARQVRLWGSS